jgi:hypothetical protein
MRWIAGLHLFPQTRDPAEQLVVLDILVLALTSCRRELIAEGASRRDSCDDCMKRTGLG